MLVCAAMLLAPLLALVPLASSDPVDTDNPDYTRTVTWDFATPEDYTSSGMTVVGGYASLELVNESVTEDSQDDYERGSLVNIDSTSNPGTLHLDEMYAFKTSMTINPDAVAGEDSHIYQDKDTENYGSERGLRIDSELSRVYRILIKFDLSTIPAGAYVDRAILWMYESGGGKGNDIIFEVHALDKAFVEDEVTWANSSAAEFWTTPGGDYTPEVYSTGVLDNVAGWKTFEMSNLVERWVRGAMANHGMIIIPNEAPSDSVKEFYSSDETAWYTLRPYLEITYTMQGNEGSYESTALGPGTNCTFTSADWANTSLSLLNDEFSEAPLPSKWAWWNNPAPLGGSYNVGLSTPGWLHVTGSPSSVIEDSTIGSNYLYQNVTEDFEAITNVKEFFTESSMSAGILLVDNNYNWVLISKADMGAAGRIEVVLSVAGVSSVVATEPWPDSNAHLRMIRNATGITFYAGTDGQSWTEVYDLAGIETLKKELMIGLFVSSDSPTQPVAEFNHMRVEPIEFPAVDIMLRTGNSTSLSDPSWTDWSSPFPERGTSLDVTAKYIRYRVYASTDYEWFTPAFLGFTAHWERYSPTGYVETEDCSPADFSSWIWFNADHDVSQGSVEYHISTDNGGSWGFFTSEAAAPLFSLEPTIRIRAVMSAHDTLVTPSVDDFSLTYGTALSTFYVICPSSVVAGDEFTVDMWAKNAENKTMTNYVGPVELTAMNAAGTAVASSELSVTSAHISSAGHSTLEDQRYCTAETIRVMIEAGGMVGLSNPIGVQAGPIASLHILPEGLDSVDEDSTAALQAAATDEYGNIVPSAEYEWTITEGLGELSSTTGPSVTLTPGAPHSEGYVNVSSEGFFASRFITVLSEGHPPEFLSDIPDQYVQEDGPTWSYNLTSHVTDPVDGMDDLRWYVTDEDLVTASDENKTGNMMLTLTPKPDVYGEDLLRLHIVDSEGGSTSRWFSVNIEPINDAPTIKPLPSLVIRFEVHYLYNLQYYIEDVDNSHSELSLSVDDANEPYILIDNSRLSLVFVYPEEMNGTTQIAVVTVSDGNLTSSTIVRVTVSDENVPVLTRSLPSIVLYQGEALIDAFDLDDYFMDIDGDTLRYSCSSEHVLIDFTDSNEVSVYAPADWSGEEYVIFSAVEPSGARAEDAVHVTVMPVNQAPWIADVPDLQVRFDKRYDFDTTAYIGDEDDSIDALVISTDDSHIAVIGTTLSMLYPASMNGTTHSVEITVSDGEFTDSWMVNVTVSHNNPPESLGPPDHSFFEDWPIQFPTSGGLGDWFSDEEDGSDLTIEAFCWCDEVGVTVISDVLGNQFARFQPLQDYYGETEMTIRAMDSDGAIVEDSIKLSIISLPDTPVFNIARSFTATVGVDVSYDLSEYIEDPDSEPSQMSLVVGWEYVDYITVTSTLVRMHFPESFLDSDESSRTVEVDISVYDQDEMYDISVMRITVVKPVTSQTMGLMGLLVFLLAATASLATVGLVIGSRRKPFIIRDMMLVHEDGFLISRHEIAKDDDDMDEDIFTGMLTAVLNFVEDSMSSEQESLRFFGFEHYRIMIKRGERVYAAVVFEGDRPKDIDDKLAKFLEKVEKVYRKSLMNWTGDIDVDFAGAHLMIETFVNQNTKKPRGINGGNGLLGRKHNGSEPPEEVERKPSPVRMRKVRSKPADQTGSSSASDVD